MFRATYSEGIESVIANSRVVLAHGNISLKKAQDTMGREIFRQLPNGYKTMVGMRNNGVPLVEQAPKAAITQAIIGMAEELSGGKADPVEEVVKSGKGRLLGFLSKAKTGK